MSRNRHVQRRRRQRTNSFRHRPILEVLEDRRVLATLTVSSNLDTDVRDSHLTLREAILLANGDGSLEFDKLSAGEKSHVAGVPADNQQDRIHFNISGAKPEDYVIQPTINPLPQITDSVIIDGYTQLDSMPNSNPLDKGNNAKILIELDGGQLPRGVNGLVIKGENSVVRGLAIHSFREKPLARKEILGVEVTGENGHGILLLGAGGHLVEGNFLGTTAAAFPLGNASGVGVGSLDNTITNNVVAWNDIGIAIGVLWQGVPVANVHGNDVQANYIGTAPDGVSIMSNIDSGVVIALGAYGNTIGGATADVGNVISGNNVGIAIVGAAPGGAAVGGNTVQKNLIGADKTGKLVDPDGNPQSGDELGNSQTGIAIIGSPNNTIEDNVISGNATGVLISGAASTKNMIALNRIGADITATKKIGNSLNGVDIQSPDNDVQYNFIFGNGQSGVYLQGALAKKNKIAFNFIGPVTVQGKHLGNVGDGVTLDKAVDNTILGNFIAGNHGSGVQIVGAEAQKNLIQKNFIGIDDKGENPLGNAQAGVAIIHGSDNTVDDNVIADNKISGVLIWGPTAKKNKVYGNRIGTDALGAKAVGNTLDGVYIKDAPENEIGHTDVTHRNVISGNTRYGVSISGAGAKKNLVFGNYIGTNKDGTDTIPNHRAGVHIQDAPENIIGGATANHRNVISGNLAEGVAIRGEGAWENQVVGNYIGTDKNGKALFHGNFSDGVLIDGARDSRIGGIASKPGATPGNLISGNGGSGAHLKGGASLTKVQSNIIGRDADDVRLGNLKDGILIDGSRESTIGDETNGKVGEHSSQKANVISANARHGVQITKNNATNNTVRRNSIYDNDLLGINLVGRETDRLTAIKDDITPNDMDDIDDGPNGLLNFPVGVTSQYDGKRTFISGVLATENPDQTEVDIYVNPWPDTTKHGDRFGEGHTYLATVIPNKRGVFHWETDGALAYPYLSATATDGFGIGATSEFSPVYGDPDGDGKVDSDEDGLPDDWETRGVDFNGDAIVDLNLAGMGAKWDHKDVFLEIDHMAGRALLDDSVSAVITAFQKAPIKNLDGTKGIHLVANKNSVGDTIPLKTATWFGDKDTKSDDFSDLKRQYLGTATDRISPYVIGARRLTFHYCIVANAVENFAEPVGGVSEALGNDFMLTLHGSAYGSSGGRVAVESGTLMHELGHNLGLGHGGPIYSNGDRDSQAGINFKPNHLSVMNYAYQLRNRVSTRPLDYSRLDANSLVKLDETDLDEDDGIDDGKHVPLLGKGPGKWDTVAFAFPGIPNVAQKAPSRGWIDWNKDGSNNLLDYELSVNEWPNKLAEAEKSTLESREEWSHLIFNFRASSDNFTGGAPVDDLQVESERRIDELAALAEVLDADDDGLSNATDNAPFVFNPDQADRDGDGVGDAGELLSFELSHDSVRGGGNVTGTVSLLVPAPVGGTRVHLYSGELAAATAPLAVLIPEGQRSATFTIETSPLLTAHTPVTISAEFWGEMLRHELIVAPGTANADLEITKLAVPDDVTVGATLTYNLTATNHGPAPVAEVTVVDTIPDGVQLVSAKGSAEDSVRRGPGVKVRFDYTYDTDNFFDTQEKKNLMQLAGDTLVRALGDDLGAILPAGSNTWTATFTNPASGLPERLVDLAVAENELVVFVGGRDLGAGELGRLNGVGGPGGGEASGTPAFLTAVATRGETGAEATVPSDFGPWGGSISFNTNPATQFHFGPPSEIAGGEEVDFFTAALHEMAHVLGFGTSASWLAMVDPTDQVFHGPMAVDEYDDGGPVPLEADLYHWVHGTLDQQLPTLLEPAIAAGTSLLLSPLDWAALADIGWNVDGLLHGEKTIPYEQSEGTLRFDVGALNPGDTATFTIEVIPLAEGVIRNQAVVSSPYLAEADASNNSVEVLTTVAPKTPIIVNSNDDTDDGAADAAHTSLREAIKAANLDPLPDTILFDIPGQGPHTIQPTSPLPTLTSPVVIDATSEPDFDGVPVVELDGSLAGEGVSGLHLTAGNSTIRGWAINRFLSDGALRGGNGIVLETGDANTIEGNYIGTDLSGLTALGNEGAGILVLNSQGNTIGGATSAQRNILSGNGADGLVLASSDNQVLGNYIGLGANGIVAVGNERNGVTIDYGGGNTIGGSDVEARNIISGNRRAGVELNLGALSQGNRVAGNFIGTNVQGDAAVANNVGIVVNDSGALGTLIGGATIGEGNVISGNQAQGIWATSSLLGSLAENRIVGNWIGTQADGLQPLGNGAEGIALFGGFTVGGIDSGAGNTIAHNAGAGVLASTFHAIRGNSIHANGGLGIDLVAEEGVTANDAEDIDFRHTIGGLEHPQNFPELHNAFSGGGQTTIDGILAGPTHAFTLVGLGISVPVRPREISLDFYASPTCDASGHGEGMTYLGSTTVVNRGRARFSATLPVEVAEGHVITATATEPFRAGNTSEFSSCVAVVEESDGDGVPDAVEDAGPGGGDANADGVPDRTQRHIASLPNAADGQYVVLAAAPGAVLLHVRAVANPAATSAPAEASFPLEFFEFSLFGDVSSVTVFPPQGIEPDSVYNFGGTPDNANPHWYQFLYDGTTGAEISPTGVVLQFIDRLRGDHDLNQNGVIVTRMGPAVFAPGAGATIFVNSNNDIDDGACDATHCSLREAILASNLLPGRDTIAFNIPSDGPHTIQPATDLPTITDGVVIDGYTQPGAQPASQDMPAALMIEIDGSLAAGPASGLTLAAGQSVVRGLAINRFRSDNFGRGGAQILLQSDGNIIEGNHVGTDVAGTVAFDPPGYAGVQRYGVLVESADNLIGGATPEARNVISGLGSDGVHIGARFSDADAVTANRVQGNYIGADSSGESALGNSTGVQVIQASGNTIGGMLPTARNVISGNLDVGVQLYHERDDLPGTTVIGNFIGADVTGTLPLGNGAGGINVRGWSSTIGGAAAGGNLISGNQGPGLVLDTAELPGGSNVVQGNLIGTDLTGTQPLGNEGDGIQLLFFTTDNQIGGTASGSGNTVAFNGGDGVAVLDSADTGNAILGNSIFANAGLGIDLAGDGVTANDVGDTDQGPNQLQNFPELTNVSGTGVVTIEGSLTSTPETTFRIEFFSGSPNDATGDAEGRNLLGAQSVTTNADGLASFVADFPGPVPLGHLVTATATDPAGNTSEFSPPIVPAVGELDFGDAPGSGYATAIADDGARHVVVPGFSLGELIDSESDGKSDPRAEGDDTNGRDDEDGVQFLTPLVAGDPATIRVRALARGYLDAWIDFDADGDWDEAGDRIFSGRLLQAGENELPFTVPATAAGPAATFARFRFSSAGHLSFDTLAADGEVEDYAVALATRNQPPLAEDDDAMTAPGTPVALEVLANDSDPEGMLDHSTLVLLSQPASGVATLDPLSGTITYTPRDGFAGSDVFGYEVRDDAGLAAEAVVTVDVSGNQPPLADDDQSRTDEDTPVTIAVTANDRDPDGVLDLATLNILTAPSRGSTTVDPQTGEIVYVPDENVYGNDTFRYEICDAEGACDAATVVVHVDTVNDAPRANDDTATTIENESIVIDVLANDEDADDNIDPSRVAVAEGPADGLLMIDPATGEVEYVPAANFTGADLFKYEVCDASLACDTATATIVVQPQNSPPTPQDDTAVTDEDNPVNVDVTSNDIDIDANLDPGSVRIVGSTPPGSVDVDSGTGVVTYIPDADANGVFSFVYEVGDTNGASETALVIVRVNPVNDPPVAADDVATTIQNQAVIIDVLGNDADVDSSIVPGSLTVVSGPSDGVLEMQENGWISYTPALAFQGEDQFTYTVRDGQEAISNEATVIITVRQLEPASIHGQKFQDSDGDGVRDPEELGISGWEIELRDGQGAVVAATTTVDADLDGDQMIDPRSERGLYWFQGLAPGSYVVSERPRSGWSQTFPSGEGLYAFELDEAQSVVGLDFGNRRNTAPMAVEDAATTGENRAVTIDVLANDSNVGGDPLSVKSASDPPHGAVHINVDNTITYTPDADFSGTDTFNYTATDGAGGSDTATVTVVVEAIDSSLRVSGPTNGVSCAAATFTITAPFDQTEIVYEFDWDGDGSLDETLLGMSRITVDHNFGADGMFDVRVTATDDNAGAVATTTFSVLIEPAGMVGPDVYACGNAASNRIIASARGLTTLGIRIDDGTYGPFQPGPGGRFFAIGLAGDDRITVSGNVSLDTVLSGGQGRDYLAAGPQDDTILGGEGNDKLLGGEGQNTLSGGGGDDRIIGRSGAELLKGGAGNDRLIGSGGVDMLYGELGNDQLVGGSGDDLISGGLGEDILDGESGDDVLLGGGGRDRIRGNAGNDLLIAGTTSYDANELALQAILDEWATDGELEDRIARLDGGATGPGGNGIIFLRGGVTVFSDDNPDGVDGGQHPDWLFVSEEEDGFRANSSDVVHSDRGAPPTKFYVVDSRAKAAFRYGGDGAAAGVFALYETVDNARGATSNAAGDTVWTIDGTAHDVAAHDADGNLRGTWRAEGLTDPQGITTDGQHIWVVDKGANQVLQYLDVAMLTSGIASAGASFNLHADNASPSGIATDGGVFWITDDGNDEVFVYSSNGNFLGGWKLDAANTDSAGITNDPGGGGDLWVVDRHDRTVYRYEDSTSRRNGMLAAASSFSLAGDNTHPEGIADPPSLSVGAPINHTTLTPHQRVLGAGRLQGEPSATVTNVAVNYLMVDTLGAGGDLFSRAQVDLGHNVIEVAAFDSPQEITRTSFLVRGAAPIPGQVGFSALSKVHARLLRQHGRTSFDEGGDVLFAALTAQNAGWCGVYAPLLVGFQHLIEPSVHMRELTGIPQNDLECLCSGQVSITTTSPTQ